MRIAYIMQNYKAVSELWIQRHLSMLATEIAFIAALDSNEKKWKGKIPVINLYTSYPLIKKILIRLKVLSQKTPAQRYNEILKREIKKHQVDVIFVNFLTLSYELRETLLSTNVPVVIHTHGYDITWDLKSPLTGEKRFKDDYLTFVKLISKKSLLIANSTVSYEWIRKIGVAPERIIIKYFGVDVEKVDRSAQVSRRDNVVTILFLGRLIDCKGPDLVIQAFEKACAQGLKGRLVIAGGGDLEYTCRLLKARSPYKNSIDVLGVVDAETGKKLREEADIFTAHNCKSPLTNQEEAFGVSIIEAMGAGLPVVTGKSGGVVDSVIDGETGFLFSPGDIEEQARLFLRLANEPELREKMSLKAIERVRSNFSMEAEKRVMMNLLKNSSALIFDEAG